MVGLDVRWLEIIKIERQCPSYKYEKKGAGLDSKMAGT